MSLRARVGAFFFEGDESRPVAPERQRPAPGLPAIPPLAVVLGPAGSVVPVAAAVAGELRARERAPAALICTWRPAGPSATASPAGAATLGARRAAQRLADRGAAATACGRLAWLVLDDDPGAAAVSAHRAVAAAVDAPAVIAVAAPRPAPFESLLAAADLAVVVLPSDADPALASLALSGLPAPSATVQPPLAPGPARWAAMAGLARLRGLPEVAGR